MKATRKNLITLLVTVMLAVNPFAASVYAEGETEVNEDAIPVQEETQIEEIAEEKVEEAVIEIVAEEKKIEEIAVEEKAEAVQEIAVEEIKEVKEVKEEAVQEVLPAEEMKKADIALEEKKAEALPAEALPVVTEEKKTEVPAEAAPVQAEAEKIEAPKEEVVVKEAPIDEALTLHITNILWTTKASSNGNVRPYAMDQKISKNGAKTMTATAVLNWAGGKNTKSQDERYSYTFLNGYVLSDGSGNVIRTSLSDSEMIKKIQNKGNGNIVITFNDGSTMNYEGYELTISPAYSAVEKWYLDLHYIDNISTGSGSWSGSSSSLSHIFRNPDAQAHYQFLYWENASTGAQYRDDQKVTFNQSNTPAGTLNVYAIWQPSVTVNYFDHEGNLIDSVEKFDSISVYDVAGIELEGCTFLGWKADEEILAEDAAFNAPEASSKKADRYEVNVYAIYSTSYAVEHYLEDLNGEFVLEESATFEDVLLGTEISAQANEYEGFTFDAGIEGTKMEDKVAAGSTLKFFYTRNSYNVTYTYGEAPNGASELPEAVSYKFGAPVAIADAAKAPGYTFSGWDIDEDFTMPAEDVEIKGSWSINRYRVLWLNDDNSLLETDEDVLYLDTPSFDGATPVKESDGIYTYEFDKWTPELKEVTEDVTYIASYIATLIPVIEEKHDEPAAPEIIETPAVEEVRPAAPKAPVEEIVVEEDVIEVEEDVIPAVEEVVSDLIDEEIPMANVGNSWALINLLAAAVSTLTAVFMALSYFRNKKDEEENEEIKRNATKFLGILPSAASIILFILTEDMRNPMVLIDRYTLMMLVIMAVTLILSYLTRNQKKEMEEERDLALSADL